jgi:hypothetical protein
LVRVVPVVRRRALLEQMQAMVHRHPFQVVASQRGQQLVVELVVMATAQVLLVDQAVEVVTEEQVDLQLRAKEILDPLAYPTTILTGLVAVVVVQVALVQHQAL